MLYIQDYLKIITDNKLLETRQKGTHQHRYNHVTFWNALNTTTNVVCSQYLKQTFQWVVMQQNFHMSLDKKKCTGL